MKIILLVPVTDVDSGKLSVGTLHEEDEGEHETGYRGDDTQLDDSCAFQLHLLNEAAPDKRTPSTRRDNSETCGTDEYI